MAIIKCKMCGGELEITVGTTVAECEYCGSKQTVPTADNEKKLALFSRANRLRYDCEFDKAAGVYEAIVADFPEEAEAYWGLVLCKYGIEYVDDPATGNKVPTCHRSSFDSVMDDHNFDMVMEHSDVVARKVYREEAKQIEELRKDIIEVSGKEEPYDIFICYKETAEDGNRTIDSVLAQDVYDALVDNGYRVFFSRITLEDKLGREYEPYIFAALNSAKVMLAFGTCYDYFNAVWVKNEWSRYLQLMEKDKNKHLIPCYKGIDAYDIPKEFSRLQAQNLGKVGAVQDLLRGIGKIVSTSNTQEMTTAAKEAYHVESYISRVYDEIECKDYISAKSALDIALTHAPNDSKVLLAAIVILPDKREHFYKKYIKAVPSPDSFEIDTITESSNKEVYLYVFYILNDINRVKFCLEAGASPNELHEELNNIVRDGGIFTCDPSYNDHNGYSTVFFDAVYKKKYDVVELCLKAGATLHPEKLCKLQIKNIARCANPARCAVMARIMRENDLQMLKLISQYISEVVNTNFSRRTEREAYSCKADLVSELNFCVYTGGIQTPLSYCVEHDTGEFYNIASTFALAKGGVLKPIDAVFNANYNHRYLETAKWLVEHGADVQYVFDAVMFDQGTARAVESVSVLSCAVDRGNYEMVKLLVETGRIATNNLSIAATWSRDKTITDYLASKGATVRTTNTKTSSGGCYVATAVYGSYDCPEVWTLRRFRDNFLQAHLLGRLFVKFYYAVSPTIVRWFGNWKVFNILNRNILDRFTRTLKEKGYSDQPYNDR